MDVDALLARVAETRLAPHAGWFRKYHRPAISVTMGKVPVRIGASRASGAPDLPIGMAWPTHEKGPYRFLAQIDLAELPSRDGWPAPWRDAVPSSGLLSLFVADDPSGEIDPEAEIFWGDPRYARAVLSPVGASLAPQAPPALVELGAAVGLSFHSTSDVPDTRELVSDFPFDDDADLEACRSLRAGLHASGHLFGYPTYSSLAYDPTPAGHVPLLTLPSDEDRDWFWHDGDWLMLFLDPARVRPGLFELRADAG